MAVVGLIPAAGHGTRLGRLEGSKEVQFVRGKPVIEYLIERMIRAGADRIRVVIRPQKQDIAAVVRRWGPAEVVVGNPHSATASIALAAEGLSDSDVALFGFPDTIWSPVDGFVRLRQLVEDGEELALGVFESPYPARSDVVVLDPDGRVARIDVKPEAPSTDRVWACGAARTATLRDLTTSRELGAAMSERANDRPIAAALLGRVIDIGTPEALGAAAEDAVFGEN